MTADEALETIRRLGAASRFFILPHARQRCAERGLTPRDVRHGLANARGARWQPTHGTWKVDAEDTAGDALTLAVEIQASVIVVTVF